MMGMVLWFMHCVEVMVNEIVIASSLCLPNFAFEFVKTQANPRKPGILHAAFLLGNSVISRRPAYNFW